jgi:hypothetical protein
MPGPKFFWTMHLLVILPLYVPLWTYKYCGIMIILWIGSFRTIDALFEYLPYQILTVRSRPTVVLTGNGVIIARRHISEKNNFIDFFLKVEDNDRILKFQF